MNGWYDVTGQSWLQLGELALAFVLSAVVGLEREMRQKSAGLRTYSLVGVSAALFVLVSKYGFMDVLESGRVVVDPSRVAAQIVSGIGFIGAGVIFMRRDVVRGLTTAASIWLTAALGMACGAGLTILALATTVGYFLIMFVYPKLVNRFLPKERKTPARLQILYQDRRGALQDILVACTHLRFAIDQVEVERSGTNMQRQESAQDLADIEQANIEAPAAGSVMLSMLIKGKKPVVDLIARLSEIDGVIRVSTLEDEAWD